MNQIVINIDKKIIEREFKNYFNYSWINSVTAWHLIRIVLHLLFIMALILKYSKSRETSDLAFIFVLIALFLIYPLTFFINKIRFNNWVNRHIDTLPKVYNFSFDDSGIRFQAEKFNADFKWEYFASYELNRKNGAIYLFNQHKKLNELISKRVIGEDMFTKIATIITVKLPPKK